MKIIKKTSLKNLEKPKGLMLLFCCIRYVLNRNLEND